jgi:hypothetical protein
LVFDELSALLNDPDEIQEEIEATEAKVSIIRSSISITVMYECVYSGEEAFVSMWMLLLYDELGALSNDPDEI